MKVQISGTRDGDDWPGVGEVVDLPADEAQALLDGGMAVPVKAEPEKATAKKAETRKG